MRFTGNFLTEGAHARGGSVNLALLFPLVACAVVAVASGAVILSLVASPVTRPGVTVISPRAIVRSTGTSETTKIAQDQPAFETSRPPAVISMVSSHDEPVAQTEAEHQGKAQSQQSQKRSQRRMREPHWRGGFAHDFWPWPRFGSRRDELTSGAR